jgi:hypothetical protein
MPINTSNGVSLIPSSISGFFGSSIKSPFWLALIITVCILLIIIFVYPAKKSAPVSKLIKLMIYIFVGVLIFLMLHDNVLHDAWKAEHEDKSAREMIGGIGEFLDRGGEPLIPTNFGEKTDQLIAKPRISTGGLLS